MKFATALRRRRSAGLVVIAFALVVLGGVYAVMVPTDEASAQNEYSTQVEEGKKLFAVNCSSCHGLTGEGIEDMGPSLVGVGAAAVDFQVGTGRMPAQQPGVQIPRGEVKFTDEEIAQLAAYVASLGGGPAVPGAEEYDTSSLSDAEIGEGGELFRTNCASCHNVGGKGGALPWGNNAPSLDGVEPRHIFEAMLTGPQEMPVFSDQVMTPDDKRRIIGYLEALDEQPTPGADLGSLGPVSEGLWAWLVGIGALVLATVWITAKGARVKRRAKGAE